jgi:ABC-type multidrug transport system fused ATPase/permease subunit
MLDFLVLFQHRLSTILDCDRIVVLDKGKIVEDGTPGQLLNKNLGIFSTMLRSSEEGSLGS